VDQRDTTPRLNGRRWFNREISAVAPIAWRPYGAALLRIQLVPLGTAKAMACSKALASVNSPGCRPATFIKIKITRGSAVEKADLNAAAFGNGLLLDYSDGFFHHP
jgi:hypothetical protein